MSLTSSNHVVMDLMEIFFLIKGQPLKFYKLVIIGPLYIKMQGDTPLDLISAKGWENPHLGIKYPYNLKSPQSHLTSGAWISLGQLICHQDRRGTSLCGLIT